MRWFGGMGFFRTNGKTHEPGLVASYAKGPLRRDDTVHIIKLCFVFDFLKRLLRGFANHFDGRVVRVDALERYKVHRVSCAIGNRVSSIIIERAEHL